MKIKEGFIVVVLTVLLLGLALGGYIISRVEKPLPEAREYSQLLLSVCYGTEERYINIWQNEEKDYYFFLPGNTELEHIKFANLGSSSLWLDDVLYQGGNISLEGIVCGREYILQMETSDGKQGKERLYFIQSGSLPSIFIDTESGTLDNILSDKNIQEAAVLYLYDESGEAVYDKGSGYLKCRGHSTFYEMEKKSFQFRLKNKKALLGMSKAKKWVLLANAKDGTFLRNKLIYDFAENHSDVEGIEGRHVDLYINGAYAGNYYLCEKVEVGEERLNIQDLADMNEAVNSVNVIENGMQFVSDDGTVRAVQGLTNPPDITGGYLVVLTTEADYNICRSGFTTSMGYYYKIVSPEVASFEEVTYIQSLFNEFEAALAQEDGINPDTGKHISEYMDLELWAQKFLIEEGFQNVDASSASIYFYKDSDSVDFRLKSGPVWDYDRAMGAYLPGRYSGLDNPKQLSYYCVYSEKMLQHEEVRKIVCRLLENWFAPYVKQELVVDVAYWEDYLRSAANMNRIRWPEGGDYYNSYEANCEYLIEFMQTRIVFLEEALLEKKQYHTVTFLTVDGSPNWVYTVQHGGYMEEEVPSVVSYVGIFAGWKNIETGIMYNERLPVLEDMVYEAQWIPADLIVKNGLAVDEINVQDVDVEALQALVDAIREMQGSKAVDNG